MVFVSTGAKREISHLFSLVGCMGRRGAVHVSANGLGSVLTSTATHIRPPSSGNGQLGVCCVARTSAGPPAFIYFYGGTRLFRFSCRHCLRGRVHSAFNLRNAPIEFMVHRENSGW